MIFRLTTKMPCLGKNDWATWGQILFIYRLSICIQVHITTLIKQFGNYKKALKKYSTWQSPVIAMWLSVDSNRSWNTAGKALQHAQRQRQKKTVSSAQSSRLIDRWVASQTWQGLQVAWSLQWKWRQKSMLSTMNRGKPVSCNSISSRCLPSRGNWERKRSTTAR